MKSKYNKHYTAEEDELLRKLYPTTRARELADMLGRHERSIVTRAFTLGLHKDPEFMRECSKAGQFKQGHTPMNKGRKWDEYMSAEAQERALQTAFKSGHIPKNHVEVGTEVKTTDGYWKVKIAEPNVWDFKHFMVWREHHGEIPKGSVVYFVDGDKDNVTIDNLALTDRAGHGYRTMQNRPLELKQLYQLKGALKRQLNKLGKNEDFA